jgi:hypothetical protein
MVLYSSEMLFNKKKSQSLFFLDTPLLAYLRRALQCFSTSVPLSLPQELRRDHHIPATESTGLIEISSDSLEPSLSRPLFLGPGLSKRVIAGWQIAGVKDRGSGSLSPGHFECFETVCETI